jgi:hypothetical protein
VNTEGLLDKNRNRRRKAKRRILCGSLGAFAPTVLRLWEFSAENIELFRVLAVEKIVLRGHFGCACAALCDSASLTTYMVRQLFNYKEQAPFHCVRKPTRV